MTEIAFRHPLIQAVAYQTLLVAKRRTMHLEIAEPMESILPDSTPGMSGMLAYHFNLSGDVGAGQVLYKC